MSKPLQPDAVLPPEKKGRRANILKVAPERSLEERSTVIHDYHHAARTAYAQSAMYALLCGFELHAARAQLSHGQWEGWVKDNCPFTCSTAWRYMEAAKRKFKEIPNLAHVQDFAVGVSPLALPAPQRDKLIDAVKEATDGQTWRQLGLALGLMSKPKTGYQKHHPRKEISAEDAVRLETEAARKTWQDLAQTLDFEGLQQQTWGMLEKAEKEALVGLLDKVSKLIKKVLR